MVLVENSYLEMQMNGQKDRKTWTGNGQDRGTWRLAPRVPSPVHNNVNNDNNDCIQRRSSRFFFKNLLAAPLTVSNTYALGQGAILCKSRATHRALITCNVSCATWYEWTAQLLSLTELKWHFILALLACTQGSLEPVLATGDYATGEAFGF